MEKKKKAEAAAAEEGGAGSTAGEAVEGGEGENTEGDEEPQAPKTVSSNSSVPREYLQVPHNRDLWPQSHYEISALVCQSN